MAEEHSDKINWMYEGKNSTINHEQYLLGKRITTISNEDEEKGDFLVKPESSVATGNVTVLERLDYESKVREDPLFQIRKNDYEHRKELLSNPLKKKRIQNMLKEALERDLRRSGTRQEFSNSSSDESSSTDSSSSSEDEKRRHKHRSKQHRQKHDIPVHKSSKHDDRHKESRTEDRTEKHHSSKSSEKSKDYEEPRNRRKPDGFGLMCLQDGKHVSTAARKRRLRTPSPEKTKERYQRVNRSGFSRRLTKEELEKKRKEMTNNASWRDSQRKDNVKKFKMDDAREDEKERKQELDRQKDKYGHSRDFLHKMKLKTASSGSVEDSVRRKKHTLSHKF